MKPREFQEFAIACYGAFGTEASARSAISRAYYAALLRAERLAVGRGVPEIKDESPHKAKIMRFEQVPGTEPFVSKLYALKELREAADYHLNDYAIPRRREKAIQMAQEVLDWIDHQPQH